jgi:hypothetical protein
MGVESLRQRLAAADIVADRLQQARHRGRRRQADQHFQRAIERQPRAKQGRKLASDRQQVVARYAPRREPAPALRRRRSAGALAADCRLDPHRHQPLVTQPADDLRLVGRFQLAGGDIAGGIDRPVLVQRHQRPATTCGRRRKHETMLPQPDTSFRA